MQSSLVNILKKLAHTKFLGLDKYILLGTENAPSLMSAQRFEPLAMPDIIHLLYPAL